MTSVARPYFSATPSKRIRRALPRLRHDRDTCHLLRSLPHSRKGFLPRRSATILRHRRLPLRPLIRLRRHLRPNLEPSPKTKSHSKTIQKASLRSPLHPTHPTHRPNTTLANMTTSLASAQQRRGCPRTFAPKLAQRPAPVQMADISRKLPEFSPVLPCGSADRPPRRRETF